MIKPVYFGNSREDKFLLNCANKMDNFSDWVKTRLIEEFNVRITCVSIDDTVNYKRNHNVKEKAIEISKDRVEEKVDINTDEIKEEILEETKIDLNQWTL